MEQSMNEPTPVPPPLTAEKVESKLLIRPEHPVTSKTVETLQGFRDICCPCEPIIRQWSSEVSRGDMKRAEPDTLRQVDPVYSPMDLFPAPKGERPRFWLTPDDMKLLIKIPRQDCDELQKAVVFLFFTGMDLVRRCIDRESLMHNVYIFTHLNIMTAVKSLRLECPEHEFPTPAPGNSLLPEHGIVANADQESKIVEEWLQLFDKNQLEKRGLPKNMAYCLEFLGADNTRVTSLKNMNRQTCGLTNTAPPCTEVVNLFCRDGITEQQRGRSYNDNIQSPKVHYQAYKETLADHKAKLTELN